MSATVCVDLYASYFCAVLARALHAGLGDFRSLNIMLRILSMLETAGEPAEQRLVVHTTEPPMRRLAPARQGYCSCGTPGSSILYSCPTWLTSWTPSIK